MSTALDVLSAVLTHLERAEFSPTVVQALNAFAASDHTDHPGAIRELMPSTSPAGAGVLSIWLGSAVEQDKIAPGPNIPVLLNALRTHGGSLDLHNPSPNTLQALMFVGQGLVAHLARDAEQRKALGADRALLVELEDLAHVSVGAGWVHTILTRSDGQLVVLHGVEPVGAVVRYQQVGSCFHLFSLLQTVLVEMPGARNPDHAVLHALAEGGGEVHDEAWWHFGRGDVPAAELGGSIWGEGQVTDIPHIDDTQVILLWNPIMGARSWNSGFFGMVLEPAPTEVEVVRWMEPDEVSAWRKKLGLR